MKAVVTGCDTHPVRSLALMLKSVGYEVKMLGDFEMNRLAKRGYTGGVQAKLLKKMGYVNAGLDVGRIEDLDDCDVFFDIKVSDAQSMVDIFPRLEDKTRVFLINGGGDQYVDYSDHYPVVTSNFHVKQGKHKPFQCYMPFDNVQGLKPKKWPGDLPPIGLLHNAKGWGFKHIMDRVRDKTGLRVYGSYGSPDGLLPNNRVGEELTNSMCFVHLKASDCPGYALYEAFATATPVVVTDLFIERMKFHELYENDVTCLTWGKGSYKVTGEDIVEYMEEKADAMVEQIADAVNKLEDVEDSMRIGEAGYERWRKLTDWTHEKKHAFAKWMGV